MTHSSHVHSFVRPGTWSLRSATRKALGLCRSWATLVGAVAIVGCTTESSADTDIPVGEASQEVASPCLEGLQVKALSLPQSCQSNPCNPHCRRYLESFDGGVINDLPEQLDAGWSEGETEDMPRELDPRRTDKACVTGSDCQFNTQCAGPVTEACEHDKCEAGAVLATGCDQCVDEVCALVPECCTDAWDETCVRAAEETCDVSCGMLGNGTCVPWVPGETDPSCTGLDLSVAPVCDDKIPVCNHGTEVAPRGLRIVHFPTGSGQFGQCEPDQGRGDLAECFTEEEILPGSCIEVTGCFKAGAADAGADLGDREIMINPPDSGSGPRAYVPECSCRDNWSFRAEGAECRAAACEPERVTSEYRGSCTFPLPGEGGRSAPNSHLLLRHRVSPEALDLELVPDAAACGPGRWYVEDRMGQASLTLCPETCADFSRDAGTTLTAELACLSGGFEVASRAEAYTAQCDEEDRVQWGFLTYDFATPSDSEVAIRLRSGGSRVELDAAPWLDVTRVSRLAGNEICAAGSPAPCPFDVYDLLGGPPAAELPYVEVQFTSTPSSAATEVPVLHSWDLTYSCVPAY